MKKTGYGDGARLKGCVGELTGGTTIDHMRRVFVVALVVAGLVALASIHLSKGEPLPLPPGVVVVHGDVK